MLQSIQVVSKTLKNKNTKRKEKKLKIIYIANEAYVAIDTYTRPHVAIGADGSKAQSQYIQARLSRQIKRPIENFPIVGASKPLKFPTVGQKRNGKCPAPRFIRTHLFP